MNVQVNSIIAKPQYLQEYKRENFSSFDFLQIKGVEKGFLPRTVHMRRDRVPVSGRRRPRSS